MDLNLEQINISLSTLNDGSLQERFAYELAKVVENIQDPNTEWDKKRKIQINITVVADEHRDQIVLSAEVKSTLAPRKTITSKVMIDSDGEKVYANELHSGQRGQMFFDPADARLKDDKGIPVEEIEKMQKQEDSDDEIIEEQAPMQQTDKIHSFRKRAES